LRLRCGFVAEAAVPLDALVGAGRCRHSSLTAVAGLESTVAFVGVRDLDQAEQFYGSVLGLTLRDERPFALVAEVGGTEIRVTRVDEVAGAPYTVLGWAVADIETVVDEFAGRGVSFTHYDGMGQDDRGIWTAPGGARIAWFKDPDGNTLSLSQHPTH
jgi:predicted enzyme related to lactoylglutathione lyase